MSSYLSLFSHLFSSFISIKDRIYHTDVAAVDDDKLENYDNDNDDDTGDYSHDSECGGHNKQPCSTQDDRRAAIALSHVLSCHSKSDLRVISKNWSQPV